MTKQDFVREIINYKMMYFDDNKPADYASQHIDDIDDSEPKEESWFDEEGNRQDDNPNQN